MTKLFSGIYRNKKVLITGTTGFKGSWLALWLQELGAEVLGFSLPANTTPSHFNLLNLSMQNIYGDIRDLQILKKTFQDFQPDIVFHMAAQALVLPSYADPIETYTTNVTGSLNIYEAARSTPSVKAIVSITTDKVYENKEWDWGYRENDRLGGYDPYSSSKACMEIMTSSYRNSFLNLKDFGNKHHILLATARAGNVIGGGDWAAQRLIPDIARSTSAGQTVVVRNPHSTRPWQFVLEPLAGYLNLGKKLLEKDTFFAQAWNFGPSEPAEWSVEKVLLYAKTVWPSLHYKVDAAEKSHEAKLLKLDCTMAQKYLAWQPIWTTEETLKHTMNWYKNFYENDNLCTQQDLKAFVSSAIDKKLDWAK